MLRKSIQRLVQRSKLSNTPRIYKLSKYNSERVEPKTGPKIKNPQFQEFMEQKYKERRQAKIEYLDSILPRLQDHLEGNDLTKITEFDFFYLFQRIKGSENQIFKKEMARKYFLRYGYSLTLSKLNMLCKEIFIKREKMDPQSFVILISMLGKALGPDPADYIYIHESFTPEILFNQTHAIKFSNLLEIAFENYKINPQINGNPKFERIMKQFLFRCIDTFQYFQKEKPDRIKFEKLLSVYRIASELLNPNFYPDKKVIPKYFILNSLDIPENFLCHPYFIDSVKTSLQESQKNIQNLKLRELTNFVIVKQKIEKLSEEDFLNITQRVTQIYEEKKEKKTSGYFVDRLAKLYLADEDQNSGLNEILTKIFGELKNNYIQFVEKQFSNLKRDITSNWINSKTETFDEIAKYNREDIFNSLIQNYFVFTQLKIFDPKLDEIYQKMMCSLPELIESKRIPIFVKNLQKFKDNQEMRTLACKLVSNWVSIENKDFEISRLSINDFKDLKKNVKDFFTDSELNEMGHVLNVLDYKIQGNIELNQ